VDGQRILKLLPETPCAVPAIGVEISSPPGTVTGEGETPSHPAKDNSGLSGQEKSGATGKEETPSHRCGGNPGPPGIGQTLGPLVPGKAWCHLARGDPARGNLGPVAQGRLRGLWRRGNPESCAEKKALGRRRKGKLQIVRRRGNPESRDEEKALSHPAKGKPDPFDLGKPRSFGERKPRATGEGNTWRHPAWGKPRLVGKEDSPSHRRGEPPKPPGDPVDRSPGSVPGPGRWSSGAKDAEKSAGRCREAGRGPSISYMEGPRLVSTLSCPIVPDRPKPGPDDTPPPPRPFPAAAARLSACSAVRRRRYRRPVRTGGTRPAGRPPGRTNWPAGRPR
jgi:hypothetical protein